MQIYDSCATVTYISHNYSICLMYVVKNQLRKVFRFMPDIQFMWK